MRPLIRRIISLTPPALLVGFVILFSLNIFWYQDSILYQFVYVGEPECFSWKPVDSFGDLWRSITKHYMEMNGRFVCHFIVMAVSSFVPQWMVTVLNGLMTGTLLWMICRLAKVSIDSIGGVWSVTLMGWIAFDNMTDVAFYVNYIWMGVLVVGWIMMFLRHPKVKVWVLVPVALFSLIAGQAHECFALPIGFALIIYLLERRGRVGMFDWVVGTSFCIGGLTTFLSPGMLIRIARSVDLIMARPPRYDLFLLSILPVIFLSVLWRYRGRVRVFFDKRNRSHRFWLWVLIGNIILTLFTRGQFGTRAFTIGSVAIIILTVGLIPRHRLGWFWMSVLICMAVWLTWVRWHYTFGTAEKCRYVERVYLTEHPDTVWVPDHLYQYESRFMIQMEEHIVRKHAKSVGDSVYRKERMFKALPRSLRDVPRDFDGNLCRKLGKDLYLLVQSKKSPAKFVVHKNLFPGLLNLKVIPDRELHFYSDINRFDIYVDSTETWIAAFYAMEYVPYADFEITIE